MGLFDHDGLRQHVFGLAASISRNDRPDDLVALALAAGEGELCNTGALAVRTGARTGRSPKDKFIVRDGLTRDRVWWDNAAAMRPDQFDRLLADCIANMAGRDIFVQELLAGADRRHRMGVTVVSDSAWHALFIRNLLIVPDQAEAPADTQVTIVHVPGFEADPLRHGTRGGTVIALDMSRNLVVTAGTAYAGEIKKSVFSLFNFHAPERDVLPMHCSANIGEDGDVALFFGLSGTGKTTLSTDPERSLIGDDEHGWSAHGIFNLEGGCYAKTARLSATAEPEIFHASGRFGTVLENVVLDPVTKVADYDDLSLTENTRAAYPLTALPKVAAGGVGGVPSTVVFLTADAFGVLPPIARLTPEQAVYHFHSGYTAKVAGTERGVFEPQATFSACFGAPFMALHPGVYGEMLAERLAAGGASTYLLNTGWSGGAYGVGRRIAIASTRLLLGAALSGALEEAPMRTDKVFGFKVPLAVAGVADRLLDPRRTWADPEAYDRAAERLVGLFIANFARLGDASGQAAAGPKLLQAAE